MHAYQTGVAVIGAGLAGITTALELLDYGLPVILLDGSSPDADGALHSQVVAAVKAIKADASDTGIRAQIARDKAAYRKEWRDHDSGDRVNPELFFSQLRQILDDDAIVVADDGNHTFLTAELMPILGARNYMSPSDFNAMGYCVPGIIGAKLANPDRQVVGIVGDGALLMTGMELVTAVRERLGVVLFVFNDGELSQISQAQQIPYNQKTCSVLGAVDYEAFARAFGVAYVALSGNGDYRQREAGSGEGWRRGAGAG